MITQDICRFIDGHRDACMLFTVTKRLASNWGMDSNTALDFVKEMYANKLIVFVNEEEPDWSEDELIQLTQEGYKNI